jgi:MFS family permease
MGFFTDAYDLFVIGTVAAIVTAQWHLSTTDASWVTGSALLGAVLGAFVFGRVADILGRKSIYVLVAAIMVVGATASAFSPNFVCLVFARFVLGLGIGGDYPVSAVLMSEYSNRHDRGRLVGMVFSMQARPDSWAAGRPGPVVFGHQPGSQLEAVARPRRASCGRRHLPAVEDA